MLAEACGECLARLFQSYFSKERDDYKQVLEQLAKELEPKPTVSKTERWFNNMVINILLKTEGIGKRDFL